MPKGIAMVLVGTVAVFMYNIETKLATIQIKVQNVSRIVESVVPEIRVLSRIVESVVPEIIEIPGPGSIVKTAARIHSTAADITCLAKNIYYEAGVEDAVGKYAVAHVSLNRLKTGHWGKDICAVVYAKSQFSWTLLKKLQRPSAADWAAAKLIAQDAFHGYRVTGLEKSLFYHADYIKNPNWALKDKKIMQLGRHIFYTRAKGSRITL